MVNRNEYEPAVRSRHPQRRERADGGPVGDAPARITPPGCHQARPAAINRLAATVSNRAPSELAMTGKNTHFYACRFPISPVSSRAVARRAEFRLRSILAMTRTASGSKETRRRGPAAIAERVAGSMPSLSSPIRRGSPSWPPARSWRPPKWAICARWSATAGSSAAWPIPACARRGSWPRRPTPIAGLAPCSR